MTYGAWLHGDARGSFRDRKYLVPDPELEAANRSEMTGKVLYLAAPERAIVGSSVNVGPKAGNFMRAM
jgi:hypothetical protein